MHSSEVRDQAPPGLGAALSLAASWEEAEGAQQLARRQRGCGEMLNRSDSTADTLEKKLKLESSQPNTRTSEEPQRALKGGCVKQKMWRKHPANFVFLGKNNPLKDSSGPEGTSLWLLERFCRPPAKMRQ